MNNKQYCTASPTLPASLPSLRLALLREDLRCTLLIQTALGHPMGMLNAQPLTPPFPGLFIRFRY